MECGNTRNDCYHDNASYIYIYLKSIYAKQIRETTVIKIQSQNWGVNRTISMEGVSVEFFQVGCILVAMKKHPNLIHI